MRINKLTSHIIAPIALFLIAIIIYHLSIFNRLMFPDPIRIVHQLINILFIADTYSNIFLTLSRAITGISISTIIGVPTGIILGYFHRVYDLFEFIIDFFRSIPATALFPLFILFFGIGNLSKIILSAWLATLVIMVNTANGVRHANKSRIKMAKIYNTSKRFLFTSVIFPESLPNIFSGIRIGVSLVLIVIIVSEMFIGSVDGLGHSILETQLSYQIPRMYSLIILTGMIGYSLNKLIIAVERKTIHWTKN